MPGTNLFTITLRIHYMSHNTMCVQPMEIANRLRDSREQEEGNNHSGEENPLIFN